MMQSIHDILKQYWGFDQFRPLQEDIIQSVLDGEDTLALLPTGGGKSICFQVPAMAKEGMCLVISPLIALMNDQVENLNRRGIASIAINSMMNQRQIDIALDNCVVGRYKFLYVSPERIQTEMFQLRIQKMNVNLIAVDESHCISQWGYDFRPSYLKIADLREVLPQVPVLALTATATPEVVVDIQKQLKFPRERVFQKSFERSNLAYIVQKEEDKLGRLMRLINKTGGAGVLYVRNRKRCESLAKELQARNVSAEAYHAGIEGEIRQQRQQDWIQNKTQVIVATNAFGMGIDKPDVRWVVHFDLPDTIEAYFQEAGRAGRDEQKAYAVLMYGDADVDALERKLKLSFPEKAFIKRVYTALGNFFQLADGSGYQESYDFEIRSFCRRYNFDVLTTYNALKLIEGDGFLSLNEGVNQQSKLKVIMDKSKYYQLELKGDDNARLLTTLIRSYSGLTENYVSINEYDLSQRAKLSVTAVKKLLNSLNNRRLIDYFPKSESPTITYIQEKLPAANFRLSPENYTGRKERASEKMNAMIEYVLGRHCRSQFLLSYFGEKNAKACGVCDSCLDSSKIKNYRQVANDLKDLLQVGQLNLSEVYAFESADKITITQALNWLEETGEIEVWEDQVKLTD